MAKKQTENSWLRTSLRRVARWQFAYVAIFVVQILVYDSWKLIAPEAVMKRWLVTGALLIVSVIAWYLAATANRSSTLYRNTLIGLILVDIFVASFGVYTQRGMASRAVLLYVVPIIISAVLLSRTAIFATAALCAAAYVGTAVSYFVLNFNEGYKIELYGEIGFYSAMFFVFAGLLWVAVRSKQHR